MKCKACGGTGTSNWCVNGTFKTCEVCGGTGYVESPMMTMNGDEYTGEWEQHECEMCGGTGEVEVEQTNEEWFCGLSTEEKAIWLENKMTWAAQEQGTFTAKGWEKWLKQPRKEE